MCSGDRLDNMQCFFTYISGVKYIFIVPYILDWCLNISLKGKTNSELLRAFKTILAGGHAPQKFRPTRDKNL